MARTSTGKRRPLARLPRYSVGPAELSERMKVHERESSSLIGNGLIALYALYSLAHGAELARITALVVAPEHCRRGIGRLLLREVELLSRRHRVHRIEVASNARREGAHAFYRGCGYADGSLRFVKMLGD